MSRETVNYVVEKTRELMAAPTCSAETKASAQAWLDSIGTDREAAQTQKYIAELEADIMPIDNLIGFAESEAGAKVFGGAEAAGRWRLTPRRSKPQGRSTATARPVWQWQKSWKRKATCSSKTICA